MLRRYQPLSMTCSAGIWRCLQISYHRIRSKPLLPSREFRRFLWVPAPSKAGNNRPVFWTGWSRRSWRRVEDNPIESWNSSYWCSAPRRRPRDRFDRQGRWSGEARETWRRRVFRGRCRWFWWCRNWWLWWIRREIEGRESLWARGRIESGGADVLDRAWAKWVARLPAKSRGKEALEADRSAISRFPLVR